MKNRYKQAVDNKKRKPLSSQMRHRLREGLFLVSVACAVFLFISLITYHANDPGWSSTGLSKNVLNWGGRVGAWMADIFLSLFGLVAYLFPFLIVLSSWLGVQEKEEVVKKRHEWIFKSLGWMFLISSCCVLVSFYLHSASGMPADSGGIIGDLLGSGLSGFFNKTGSTLVFTTLLLFGITLVTGLSWLWVLEKVGERTVRVSHYARAYYTLLIAKLATQVNTRFPATQKVEPQLPEKNALSGQYEKSQCLLNVFRRRPHRHLFSSRLNQWL